jgi:hypothetical protein
LSKLKLKKTQTQKFKTLKRRCKIWNPQD